MPEQQFTFWDNYSDLLEQAKNYKVISFDVFDTLVYRPIVDPKSLFDIMEKRLVITYGGGFVKYAQHRVAAENIARDKAWHAGLEEVTLDEIYEQLQVLFDREGFIRSDLSLAKKLEIELEIRYIKPITKAYDFFHELQNMGKEIVLISDMYLPKDIVIKMLKAAGYNIDNINIYVSSEYGLAKHQTSLYKEVLKQNSWNAGDLLHFGDNHHADIEQARKVGISAVFLKKIEADNRQYLRCEGTISYDIEGSVERSVSLGLLQYRKDSQSLPVFESNEDNYWYLLGYNFVGSIMVALSLWVKKEAQKYDSKKILFLARDGQIVKETYDILFQNQDHTPSVYSYASRRMVSLPFATVNSSDLFSAYEDIIKNSDDFSQALEKIPGGDQLGEVILGHVPSLHQKLKDNEKNQRIFRDAIMENSHIIFESLKHEQKNVIDYLNDIIGDSKKVSVFDIGWKGSLQRSIEYILKDQDIQLQGLYFGLHEDARFNYSLENCQGFCLNYGFPKIQQHIIYQSVEIFELFFYATHGSIKKVIKDNDGEWVPELFDVGSSGEKRIHIAKILHQAVQDFTQDLVDIYDFEDIQNIYNKEKIVDNIFDFANSPKAKDAEHFVDIDFASAIGDDKGRPLICPHIYSEDKKVREESQIKSRWKRGTDAILSTLPQHSQQKEATDKKRDIKCRIYESQKIFFNNILRFLKNKK